MVGPKLSSPHSSSQFECQLAHLQFQYVLRLVFHRHREFTPECSSNLARTPNAFSRRRKPFGHRFEPSLLCHGSECFPVISLDSN